MSQMPLRLTIRPLRTFENEAKAAKLCLWLTLFLLRRGSGGRQNVASDTNRKGRIGARFHYY